MLSVGIDSVISSAHAAHITQRDVYKPDRMKCGESEKVYNFSKKTRRGKTTDERLR